MVIQLFEGTDVDFMGHVRGWKVSFSLGQIRLRRDSSGVQASRTKRDRDAWYLTGNNKVR
jgi:hypothetical protein